MLLECNFGFSLDEYVKFGKMFDEVFVKKYDIVLEKFVISFNVNFKFSVDVLVFVLKVNEDFNIEVFNFKSVNDEKFNKLLNFYNKLVNDLILVDKYVELFFNIIVFRFKNIKLFKVFFDVKSVLFRGE